MRRCGIGHIHWNLNLRLCRCPRDFSFARYPLETRAERCRINKFSYSRFQRTGSRSQEQQKKQVGTDRPKLNMRNVQLAVDQQS